MEDISYDEYEEGTPLEIDQKKKRKKNLEPLPSLVPQTSKETNQTQQGLDHYRTPFFVYQFYIKQIIFIVDAILDTVIYMPGRLIKWPTRIITHQKKDLSYQEKAYQNKLDFVHLILIISVVALLNSHRFFEMGIWYHYIRGQSQIKLYGIIQILDLLDRSACIQGDYIMRQLYYTRILSKDSLFNRYLFYSFLYLIVHSCLLGISLTVYTVIFMSGINLLYLALFMLSLIKLKGSVFKKQDQKSSVFMVQTDGREFFQKILHIVIIVHTVKFLPDDFWIKVTIYFATDILVDSFKYSQITYLNNLQSNFISTVSDEIYDFSYALTLKKEFVNQNMAMIDQKDLNQVLSQIPHPCIKMVGKFQVVVFPYIILTLKMIIYKCKKNYDSIELNDVIIIGVVIFFFSLLLKKFVFQFQRSSYLFQKVQKLEELKQRKKSQ